MKLTIKEIIKACNGKFIGDDDTLEVTSYSKDTRTIKKGDCYVAIKGETFDGNDFLDKARDLGASCAIASKVVDNLPTILVDDTILAIQKLATYVRDKSNAFVIGITGSAGKTSTKDMIASVLSEKYKVLKTPGNLNGQIGLPLNILMYQDEPVWVLEMGMNNFGELDKLSHIAKPNVAVITNIGTAHIGILGSRENILKAKLEILNGMDADGTLILNGDNDLLKTVKDKRNIVTFGLDNNNTFVAKNIKTSLENTTFTCNGEEYKVLVPGEVFIYNALASISVGKRLGLTSEEIKRGLEKFTMSGNRMKKTIVKDYTLLNDTYNANPDSVNSVLKTIASYEGRNVAVLGDMLELGEYEKELHENVGEYLNGKVDVLVTVGTLSKYMDDRFKGEKYHFSSVDEAKEEIKSILKPKDLVLFKASHSINLDKLVDFLTNNL